MIWAGGQVGWVDCVFIYIWFCVKKVMFVVLLHWSLWNLLLKWFQKMLIDKIVLQLENNVKEIRNTHCLVNGESGEKGHMIYWYKQGWKNENRYLCYISYNIIDSILGTCHKWALLILIITLFGRLCHSCFIDKEAYKEHGWDWYPVW